MKQDLSFQHRFVPASSENAPPLLLLHGTGGNENDLLGLGATISPGSALLSPRGQVLENGMPRFFKRLRDGVFDENDLRNRTRDLAIFIKEARSAYGLAAPIGVGFSNGANIAASLVMLEPECLAGAILFRPMTPFRDAPTFDLSEMPVLMISGAFDPIVSKDNADGLERTLASASALVTHEVLPVGHALS